MNYSREMDKLCHSLSQSQAHIFERSIDDGIPSFFFVKSYMLSEQARAIDDLNLESAGITKTEIYETIKNRVRGKRGKLLSYPLMHFLGYFYRSAAYLLKLTSKYLYENVPPKFLIENYQALHSLSIQEAIKDAFEANNLEIKTKEELFVDIYKRIK